MSAKAITNAKRRKKELEKELAEIDQFLELAGKFSDPLFSETPSPSGGGTPVSNSKPGELVAASHKAIKANGKPMNRSELLNALTDVGIIVSGKDPANTLGTTLSRASEKIIHLKSFGYWIVDEDYPIAGYFKNGSEGNVTMFGS